MNWSFIIFVLNAVGYNTFGILFYDPMNRNRALYSQLQPYFITTGNFQNQLH